jgi:hypothetical protein
MPEGAQARRSQLDGTLRGAYGCLGITGLREAGRGLDAAVYRADSAELGPVAVRVPHSRWVSSGNEARLDTCRQLRQDYDLSRHLLAHGLPVPEVLVLHTDDEGADFAISRFIESDGSALPDAEFGRLIRAIHEVPVPGLDLVCMGPSGDFDDLLAERIGQRLENLAVVTGLPAARPDIGALLSADRHGGPVRAENPVHGLDQQSCSPGPSAVMISGHVPAARFPPGHADRRVAAAVPA